MSISHMHITYTYMHISSINIYLIQTYTYIWASLVTQWLRVCLPMQRTRVRALVWEDPTYHEVTRPVSHGC